MFKAKPQFLLVLLLADAWVSSSLCSPTTSADGNFPSPNPRVQIRVFNLAHVPMRDTSRAENEVHRLFAEAHMAVDWAEGATGDTASLITDQSANNASKAGCSVSGHARGLSFQLLPRSPRGLAPGTLGFSLPCASFGIDSTIYVDECERVAYQSLASFNKVLAYALAHELGHILLRSTEHSPTGIMRARWDKATWMQATFAGIPLDPEQARRMRLELSRMESLATADGSR